MPPPELTAIYSIYAALLSLNILLGLMYIRYLRASLRWSGGRAQPRGPDPRPISFIIPVKGEPIDVIQSALTRFLDLDYPRESFEVLIVSDDEEGAFRRIKAVVEAFSKEFGISVRALRRVGGGRYKGSALNWAAARAKYDVLVFIDVDTRLPRDAAWRASQVDDNTILFLGWDGYISLYTRLGKILRFIYRYILLYGAYLGRALAGGAVLALGSGIALSKRLLDRLGGFCDCVADDYDISLRALAAGARIVYDEGQPVLVEIPAIYAAFRRQYARWVFDSAYVIRKHIVRLMKSRLPLRVKLGVVLDLLQHPLLITTTIIMPIVGLAAAYTGYLIPPLPITALEVAVAAVALAISWHVAVLARREGYGVLEALSSLALSGLVLLLMDVVAFAYMALGFVSDTITWRVTPKGESQRTYREALWPELAYTAVVAGVFMWALAFRLWYLASSAAALLAVLGYGLRTISPSA
ncbi:MAG: glycosyltransferase [Thermoproteus sp. AZ2]|uniref:Glycosyltransferase n=1 Tax=Thermoproteus sp. AZ2 TaxID=1609232 RepID=A0ACC6V0B4_9CREN